MNDGPSRRFETCLVALAAAASLGWATNWNAPPRFDGAGYVILGRAIFEGRGYRAIDHPDQPDHAHFPPAYPLALAAVRSVAGDGLWAIHLFSVLCAVAATVAAHRWFHLLFGHRVALVLGLALAINWVWTRMGGGIQSEPLFVLLSQLAILAAWSSRRADDPKVAILLGGLLGAAILTRHVAIALTVAVFIDLALSRRWRNLWITASCAAALVAPWIAWILWVSARNGVKNQVDLLSFREGGILSRIGGQILFYAQRIPDQITGPFVEVATVLRPTMFLSNLANTWAISAGLLIALGWFRLMRRPKSRLAGLIPMATLSLLIFWPFTEAGRFLVPILPCLLIGGVEGLSWLIRLALPGARRSRRRLAASVFLLALTLPYSMYDLAKGRSRIPSISQIEFDEACSWIAEQDASAHPGPVLTRHPAEVFLQTGRRALDVSTSERVGSRDAEPEEIAEIIARYHVAYLLIDEGRYLNAPPSPLARFVRDRAEQVRKVWSRESSLGSVSIYEIQGPRSVR